jgi:hypothetical protein
MAARSLILTDLMNYPAASYGVSKASIRNRPFAASCGELTRMRLKRIPVIKEIFPC